MGALDIAVITASRSSYYHRTAIGRIIFFAGMIFLIIAGRVLKKSKGTRIIMSIIAVVIILLSFAADFIFTKWAQ